MKILIPILSLSLLIHAPLPAMADDKSSKEIENTVVVDSGTYIGTAERVDPKEKEIYVKLEDDRIIELYLKDATEIMMDGEKVAFDALKKGQKVQVKVEKKGDSLKPLSVTIIEKK